MGRNRAVPKKSEPKPRLTDAERHKRFLEVARKVEASENPEDFEKAFKKVALPKNAKGSEQ